MEQLPCGSECSRRSRSARCAGAGAGCAERKATQRAAQAASRAPASPRPAPAAPPDTADVSTGNEQHNIQRRIRPVHASDGTYSLSWPSQYLSDSCSTICNSRGSMRNKRFVTWNDITERTGLIDFLILCDRTVITLYDCDE